PVAAPSAAGATGAVFDLSPLPRVGGVVRRLVPSPTGEVMSILLTDNTQILVPRGLGPDVATHIVPGARISARGLVTADQHLMRAFSIDDAHGHPLQDDAEAVATRPPPPATPGLEFGGRYALTVFDRNGHPAGLILDDGTVVYLSAAEMARNAAWLRPGSPVVATGSGLDSPFGRTVEASAIGPSHDALAPVIRADVPLPGAAPGTAAYDLIAGSGH
ncbi:hypothetical protein, partial [Ameyamaea chiangmaiensis]